MADLDSLYTWFDENREHIIQYRLGEQVLLKDYTVIGYYPNMDTALSAAEEKGFALGDFLIQDCVTEEEEAILFYPVTGTDPTKPDLSGAIQKTQDLLEELKKR